MSDISKKIKPLGDRFLVKRAEAKVTKGGIFLPDTAKEKPRQGEVVAKGPGKFDEKGMLIQSEVNVGDKVLFGSYAGCEVKTDTDDEYLLMSEEDILAIIS